MTYRWVAWFKKIDQAGVLGEIEFFGSNAGTEEAAETDILHDMRLLWSPHLDKTSGWWMIKNHRTVDPSGGFTIEQFLREQDDMSPLGASGSSPVPDDHQQKEET